MAYRYTNTDKWADAWFTNLSPMSKLLFNYLCDNCDIAGFIELNYKRWAVDIGINVKTIEGAIKGLGRGLIFSNSGDCIFVKNFLKHQKNLPLNEKNNAHLGIIKRFELYSFKFNIQNINEFIEGANKGLASPYGNGNGNGEGGTGETKKIIPEQKSFNFYAVEVAKAKEFTDSMSIDYVNLCRHICKKNKDGSWELPYVLKMEKQISLNDFSKLYIKADKNIDSIILKIDSIQNTIKYRNKYTDLNSTINNWINRNGHINTAQ